MDLVTQINRHDPYPSKVYKFAMWATLEFLTNLVKYSEWIPSQAWCGWRIPNHAAIGDRDRFISVRYPGLVAEFCVRRMVNTKSVVTCMETPSDNVRLGGPVETVPGSHLISHVISSAYAPPSCGMGAHREVSIKRIVTGSAVRDSGGWDVRLSTSRGGIQVDPSLSSP
jgi:hypothetical protein